LYKVTGTVSLEVNNGNVNIVIFRHIVILEPCLKIIQWRFVDFCINRLLVLNFTKATHPRKGPLVCVVLFVNCVELFLLSRSQIL